MIELAVKKKLRSATGEMELELDLQIPKRQLLALYGPSGAGKTSVLRMLAGLMKPDEGRLVVDGQTWFDTRQNINLSPQQRQIGFVFQDYALFPNMSVRQNLLFALTKKSSQTVVDELIEIMELGALQEHRPQSLSGGQQQRVALARALVQKPKLLLLDEPLSALDNTMRQKLQNYLLRVHRDYSLTTILVSHSISEVMKLSDHLIQLEQGKVVAEGQAVDLLRRSGGVSLKGQIEQVDHQGQTLWIRIGENLLPIPFAKVRLNDFSIGDWVDVSSNLFYVNKR
ncbi:MAG: ATP-binding cassette domain-containing protein [Bacteroidota bacterium]